MAMLFNYARYNKILAFIQEPKSSMEVAEYMKMERKNTRNHLYRLIADGYSKALPGNKRDVKHVALVKSIVDPNKKIKIEQLPKRAKKVEDKVKEDIPKQEWSPNMIVKPNECKRLQSLHSETARMNTLELKRKRNDVYVGSHFSMMAEL